MAYGRAEKACNGLIKGCSARFIFRNLAHAFIERLYGLLRKTPAAIDNREGAFKERLLCGQLPCGVGQLSNLDQKFRLSGGLF